MSLRNRALTIVLVVLSTPPCCCVVAKHLSIRKPVSMYLINIPPYWNMAQGCFNVRTLGQAEAQMRGRFQKCLESRRHSPKKERQAIKTVSMYLFNIPPCWNIAQGRFNVGSRARAKALERGERIKSWSCRPYLTGAPQTPINKLGPAEAGERPGRRCQKANGCHPPRMLGFPSTDVWRPWPANRRHTDEPCRSNTASEPTSITTLSTIILYLSSSQQKTARNWLIKFSFLISLLL